MYFPSRPVASTRWPRSAVSSPDAEIPCTTSAGDRAARGYGAGATAHPSTIAPGMTAKFPYNSRARHAHAAHAQEGTHGPLTTDALGSSSTQIVRMTRPLATVSSTRRATSTCQSGGVLIHTHCSTAQCMAAREHRRRAARSPLAPGCKTPTPANPAMCARHPPREAQASGPPSPDTVL